MDATILSLLCFIIITVLYYCFKPKPIHLLNGTVESSSNGMLYLILYFLVNIVIQFCINASVLATNCGGSLSKTMGMGALYTFVPWGIIFGSITIFLMIFPGLKYAFSNVIGYYIVSNQANSLFSSLFVNQELQHIFHNEQSDTRNAMERAAETLSKMAGNYSILINQIVPENFNQYWNVLQPLMKPDLLTIRNQELQTMKQSLFDMTVLRDNIGEGLWYLYTGILLIMIVKYYISTMGCNKDATDMTQSATDYQNDTQQQQDDQNQLDSQIYVS